MTDYQKLQNVLAQALVQAAEGKGAQRHAVGLPRAFERQPMLEISRMVGPGFQLGQAMKKAQECFSLFDSKNYDACKEELFGAIAYLAGAVILMDEYKAATAQPAAKPATAEPAKVGGRPVIGEHRDLTDAMRAVERELGPR